MTIRLRTSLIVAMDRNRGIGKNNTLPWRIPEDLKHFKEETTGKTVVMGRKTYESIGKPLPNRVNIVVTRQHNWWPFKDLRDDLYTAYSLRNALQLASAAQQPIYIIGGAQIYEQALPVVDQLIITHVDGEFDCDAHFPEYNADSWQLTCSKALHSAQAPGGLLQMCYYERMPH